MNLPFVETMITQACNIGCLGCTNYSDLRHSGFVPWQQGQRDIEAWLTRIKIDEFGIIGGEPLINPEWRQWLLGLRELLPQAQLRFTTNGLLLDRAPDMINILQEVGNLVFKITVHVHDPRLESNIDEILRSFTWTPVTEHGIQRLLGPNRVRFQINRPTQFLKTYRNNYSDMMPWDSDPEESFRICCQRTCPLLYQGRIYKCSTAGLLKDTLLRHGNPNFEHWVPYLDQGIGLQDSNHALKEFCDNFGRAQSICGQCPQDARGIVDHKTTVVFKKRSGLTDSETYRYDNDRS